MPQGDPSCVCDGRLLPLAAYDDLGSHSNYLLATDWAFSDLPLSFAFEAQLVSCSLRAFSTLLAIADATVIPGDMWTS